MVSYLLSLVMAASLGQAPDQSSWLKSVPADVAIVARVRAPEAVRDDLLKMLEAMSGNAAALAQPQIEQGLAIFEGQYGKAAVQHPFFVLLSLPKDNPFPGWAVLVESDNYDAVIKSVTKKDDLKLGAPGAVDSIDGPGGEPWFSTKGPGFVAFGPDETLVKGLSKPASTLDAKISAELKSQFLAGDLGIYVNIASLQAQYADQIEGAKQLFFGLMDQGGGQLDEKTLKNAKALYAALFDSIKWGDSLALNLDFAAQGLALGGVTTAKADTPAAKTLASSFTGSAADLGRLPGGSLLFSYVNTSPDTLRALAKLNQTAEGNANPDAEKSVEIQIQAGTNESYAAISDGAGGLISLASLSFSTPKNPAKAVEASAIGDQSLRTTTQAQFKDIVVTPKAETYKGFELGRTKMVLDLDKMTPANAPGGADLIKKLMGSDTINLWYGTDGKTFLKVGGKDFDQAKARIDAFVSGESSLAKVPAFEPIRRQFPQEVTTIALVSAQGLIEMIAQVLSSTSGNVVSVPADTPKETALFGGSLGASAKGLEFHFVLPSKVGPVIERGLIPLLQNVGAVAQ